MRGSPFHVKEPVTVERYIPTDSIRFGYISVSVFASVFAAILPITGSSP